MTAVVHTEPSALRSALLDPVFLACLCSAAGNAKLIAGFESLTGHRLAPCDGMEDAFACMAGDFMRFVDFVHGCIYLRLDPQVRQDMGVALALAGLAGEKYSLN